ncbi:MAG TPA: hypothetical protein VNZ45_00830 [Bacteroidia bacterium]|jgi:hypothetical protein|nr:hypothetical protein [Bacteroidia bacterium]
MKAIAEKSSSKKKKTWNEKLKTGQKIKIVDVPDNWARTIGHGKMVILTPVIINDYIKSIPKGKLTTINEIRDKFAAEHGTDTTCPITTGIFVWISAGAAEEDRADGVKNVTPYWRVLKEGGKLNPKFPGSVKQHAFHLEKEGFTIDKGKTEFSWSVKDYEKHLV